jgi:transcriptional regulator with XRE-family HTH domain
MTGGEMRKRIPTAAGNVLRSFRLRKGVTQEELGRLSGYSPRTLERMETGFYDKVEREQVVEILSHLNVPPEAVETALLADELGTSAGGEEDRLIERAVAAGAAAGSKAARAELKAELLRRQAPQHRRWAEERWSRLRGLKVWEQEKAVDALLGDDRSWALAEILCLASTEAAANRADESLRLARLAVRLAEHVPDEGFRLHLLGWVELFLANSQRVGGNLASSAQTLAHADEMWAAGAPFGALDEDRRLDLKASLLMYYGRPEEVRSLLAVALKRARTEHARARLLIKWAGNLELACEYEAALEVLQQARPQIDARSDPRLLFAHDFNKAVNLAFLDRYDEAEPLLPLIEAGTDPANELDAVRLRWLKGRIRAGVGRTPEALAALSDVRAYFRSHAIPYDFAVVSVEIGTLHLEQGRAGLVRELADQMRWIFQSQGVHEQALEALALFCHAAKMEEAQADWTRRLVKYLSRAQHNPSLRFEP